ncbi:MAG: FAD-dependent oxidoreductase [Rhodoferax sp.]
MSEENQALEGDDFTQGVALEKIPDNGMLVGHAQGEAVILARRGNELFAVGATCTHYGAPLADGLLVGDTVRCPWHHACFSLRTGEVLRAPALNPIACWRVERRGNTVYVTAKQADAPTHPATPGRPESIVIVGGGAAGEAASVTLRREGYTGAVTLLSADAAPPCDRPNLSKNFLAGTAPADWLPLRAPEFFSENHIDLRLNTRVVSIDSAQRRLHLEDGSSLTYGALLLATGAEPIKLTIPGADLPHVHYLRTQADGEALANAAATGHRAVVIGASFIGLEVAASLRARNIEVHVVGRETCPMEKILGPKGGNFIRALHEQHGVVFHLGTSPSHIDAHEVTLENGEKLPADLVVIGVGVRPATGLAEQAGLKVDHGVLVDEYLQTSAPGIFAAGDIASWPDRLSGERIRVEHWVVAGRQGQTAARNMLGLCERYDGVPFFWTEQYDFGLAYVGHAKDWDHADIDGSLDARDCTITYRRGDRKLAIAVIHRDLEGLRAEVEFERTMASGAVAAKASS